MKLFPNSDTFVCQMHGYRPVEYDWLARGRTGLNTECGSSGGMGNSNCKMFFVPKKVSATIV
jgi:hypothetical protein